LLKEIERCDEVKQARAVIARSSFTGEDRPNKSSAGQYESFANLETPVQRLKGIVGVIASTWEDTPVENNVQFQVNLQHIWPAVAIQRCLSADVSGVAISRGSTGGFGAVSYQAVEGFGGGVGGGKAEEGVIGDGDAEVSRLWPNKGRSLLTAEQQQTLRRAVLAVEREFNRTVEPGQSYAVDIEWVIEGKKLKIVQARVIVGA